jgi:hypothetical protein
MLRGPQLSTGTFHFDRCAASGHDNCCEQGLPLTAPGSVQLVLRGFLKQLTRYNASDATLCPVHIAAGALFALLGLLLFVPRYSGTDWEAATQIASIFLSGMLGFEAAEQMTATASGRSTKGLVRTSSANQRNKPSGKVSV